MIMIEHFSKWVELVTLSDKSSHNTNQAFLQQVLSRFGACVDCLTDQGSGFKGEFQDLLDHALIDRRWTSRDHPQIDGSNMPMAMENLSIAQHQDTLWYAHTRGGSYKPKVKQFDVGDYMYLQRQLNDTLNTFSSHFILRIKAIRPLGVLELQGVERMHNSGSF